MLLLFELHDPPRNVDGHRTRLDVSELLDCLGRDEKNTKPYESQSLSVRI